MPRSAAAAAPARHPRTAPARRGPASRPPARRSSGPATGRAAAVTRSAAAAAPRVARRPARPAPLVRGIISGPIGAALDWVLRGRACVVLFGALLAGVVFFNVSLLEKNEGIARMNQESSNLALKNQQLRAELAVYSTDWVETQAQKRGYYLPAAGDQRFIKRGDVVSNARKAAQRIVTPGQGTGTASKPAQDEAPVDQTTTPPATSTTTTPTVAGP